MRWKEIRSAIITVVLLFSGLTPVKAGRLSDNAKKMLRSYLHKNGVSLQSIKDGNVCVLEAEACPGCVSTAVTQARADRGKHRCSYVICCYSGNVRPKVFSYLADRKNVIYDQSETFKRFPFSIPGSSVRIIIRNHDVVGIEKI